MAVSLATLNTSVLAYLACSEYLVRGLSPPRFRFRTLLHSLLSGRVEFDLIPPLLGRRVQRMINPSTISAPTSTLTMDGSANKF